MCSHKSPFIAFGLPFKVFTPIRYPVAIKFVWPNLDCLQWNHWFPKMPVVHYIFLLFPSLYPVAGLLDILGLVQAEPNFGRLPKIVLLGYRGKPHLNHRGWNNDFHIFLPDMMHHSAQNHGWRIKLGIMSQKLKLHGHVKPLNLYESMKQ